MFVPGVARWVLLLGFLLGFIIKPKGSTNEDLGFIRFYCFFFFRIPDSILLCVIASTGTTGTTNL
jgi:hypothetical protein